MSHVVAVDRQILERENASDAMENHNNNKTAEEEEECTVGEEDEEEPSSSLTLERVAVAKQFIENHYKSHMKHIKERRERYRFATAFMRVSVYVCTGMCLSSILHVNSPNVR